MALSKISWKSGGVGLGGFWNILEFLNNHRDQHANEKNVGQDLIEEMGKSAHKFWHITILLY